MNRTPSQWAQMRPASVVSGSSAQAENVLQMAKEDIAELVRRAAEVRRLQKGYFRTRTTEALIASKEAEKALDELLATAVGASAGVA